VAGIRQDIKELLWVFSFFASMVSSCFFAIFLVMATMAFHGRGTKSMFFYGIGLILSGAWLKASVDQFDV